MDMVHLTHECTQSMPVIPKYQGIGELGKAEILGQQTNMPPGTKE